MQRFQFRWDYFGIAVVAISILHAFTVPSLLPKPAEAPIEVTYFEEPAEPEKLAANEKSDPEKRSAIDEPKRASVDEEKLKDRLKAVPPKPEPVVENTPPPEKQPEVPPPPASPPPPAPPPPPIQPPKAHQKFVDQDKFPDEADNAEATYLGQSNHRAKENKTTRNTNLAREQRGAEESPSAPSENKEPQAGMPEKKVAELKNRPGRPNEIVRTHERAGDEGKSAKTTPGKLSMRGLTPRSIEQAPGDKPREGIELSDREPGTLPAARAGTDGERAGTRAKGSRRPNLTLAPLDYDKIVGEGVAEKERRDAARAEVSHAPGRWDKLNKKVAMMRSSLENFATDAKIGNEAELGTRKHPFAAYIAEMHRSIHKLWGYGFLPALDGKGALDPYNEMDRWTQLAIRLNGDGTLDRVQIARPSGYTPFDAAAMDAIMSSAPFSTPPQSIKSVDGKVYLDWFFFRDARQCDPSFVEAHILEKVPEKHAQAPSAAPSSM